MLCFYNLDALFPARNVTKNNHFDKDLKNKMVSLKNESNFAIFAKITIFFQGNSKNWNKKGLITTGDRLISTKDVILNRFGYWVN